MSAVRSGAAARARREWLEDGPSIRFPGATPGLKRKADRRDQDHRIALSPWSWDQIAPGIEGKSRLLFPAIDRVALLQTVEAASGVTGWTWHDMRRSFRSWAAKVGIGRDAAEMVLGHTVHRSQLDATYQRHSFEREAEHAFLAWQAHIETLVEGRSAKIIALKQ